MGTAVQAAMSNARIQVMIIMGVILSWGYYDLKVPGQGEVMVICHCLKFDRDAS